MFIILFGDFNTPFLVMERIRKQEISKDMEAKCHRIQSVFTEHSTQRQQKTSSFQDHMKHLLRSTLSGLMKQTKQI